MQRRAFGPAVQFTALAGILLAGAALLPAIADVHAAPTAAATPDTPKPLSAVATLGRKLFFDAGLSASGAMACAFCHDPDHH